MVISPPNSTDDAVPGKKAGQRGRGQAQVQKQTAQAFWAVESKKHRGNAPRRNRTYNLVIKSHLLCQLS
jgi:hypothetical protein